MFRLCVLLAFASAFLSAQTDWRSRPRREERTRQYDVSHYRIQLRLDEATRSFAGETRITLRPLTSGFDTLTLDAETFQVTAVEDLKFSQAPGKLVVHLKRPYAVGEELSVSVSYRATNVAIDPERFGMPKGYGLGIAFKPATSNHPALIHTLSFPEGARHWFPCYDHPNDKASSEMIVTVNRQFQVISNGTLLGVTDDAQRGEKTFHWRQDQPHSTYLFMLAAGPYEKLTDASGSLPISYWVYPKDAGDAGRTFGKTREIIDFFSRELGYAYPWPKYDQITIPDFGGGAESTNATVIGDGTIHDAKADQDFPSHWLIAHEVAHQWWGNLLTMRDWNHTWLNEGFATYYEYLYLRHLLGPDEAAVNLSSKKQAYLAEARAKYLRPIVLDRWNWPNDNFDRHTYQKGGVVLVMLRSVMGDDAFRRSITHYLRKHAYGSVDTHDLLVAIREASGQVLDWFFEQWVYRPGHPVLAVSSRFDGQAVQLKVEQRQPDLFRIPVSIGVTTSTGKQLHRILLRHREETFTLPATEKPRLIHFDEGDLLLAEIEFPKSQEELLVQLAHDNVIGRMEAARLLKPNSHVPSVAAALRQAAASDRFWAVRRAAVFPAGAPFLQSVAADPISAVRVAALQALGELRDPSLVPFLEGRFQAEDSYLAQAAALRALGQCRANPALLRRALLMPSPGDVIRKSADAALKVLGQ